MDILRVLFIILFGTAIFESIMLGTWNAVVFRSGIVIFKRKIEEAQISDINLPELESKFATSIVPSILFHKHGVNEIFFREKMFSFNLFYYTPIMHGHIIGLN